MTTPIELDDFEAALTDDERAAYQSFQKALNEATHAKAIAGSFIAWASPIVSRLGGHNAGRVFGAFKARYGAQKTKEHTLPLSELAEQLPYPLGLKLRGFVQGLQRRDEGEIDPQFPFEVAATMGVVVRTLGVVALQAYVTSGKTNAKLNHQVVDKLRAPSDGGWLELAQTLSKATAAHHPFAQFVAGSLSRKVSLDPAISKSAD